MALINIPMPFINVMGVLTMPFIGSFPISGIFVVIRAMVGIFPSHLIIASTILLPHFFTGFTVFAFSFHVTVAVLTFLIHLSLVNIVGLPARRISKHRQRKRDD